jgi:flavin reductase (DIM6/NTAB) family NADH-FMN oxidoreductase RutF
MTMTAISPEASAPDFDPRDYRRTLGRFATGVTVVTYEHVGEFYGTTVNSFTSVSIEPPLVLVSLAKSSRAAGNIIDKPFGINVLAHDQVDVAMRFAGKPQESDSVRWDHTRIAPRLVGSHALFVCTPWAVHEAGDHILVLGQVEHYEADDSGDALAFYKGAFQRIGDGS